MDNEEMTSEQAEASLDEALQIMKESSKDDYVPEVEEPEQADEPAVDEKSAHPGAQYIDLKTATPEQIQSRLNYLTKQVKTSAEDNEIFKREYHNLSSALQVAIARLAQIEGKQVRGEQDDAMAMLKAQKREALELGDIDRAEQIDDLILEAKLAQKLKPAQPQIQLPQSAPYEAQVINQRANATNENGEHVYGYLRNDNPLNQRAAIEAAALRVEWEKSGRDWAVNMPTFLDDLHGRMQSFMPKPTAKSAPVLSGKGANLANSANGARVKLTQEERYVAKRLGLSEEEYFQSKSNIAKVRNK